MSFTSVDPATGRTLRSFASHSREEALAAAEETRRAFLEWRDTSYGARAEVLRRAAAILRDRAEEWGRLMAEEMGKPLAQGVAEAEKSAWACEYYADNGAVFLADRPAEIGAGVEACWTYRPLGTVLAIMPWNFPFWQVFRAAAPALMAGNTVLLKHAPSVPGCALACESIFRDAGLAEGVFRNLFVEVDDVAALMAHDAIQGVTLTGSVRAGRAVAAEAGALLKKCVLELGGSDPYVILSDADVDLAADRCVTARALNTGQSCISSKRLIVVEPLHDDFLERVSARFTALPVGDPMEPGSELGPMARIDLRDALHDQVRRSVEAGACLHAGGVIPDRPGAWYPATVLSDVGPGMAAYHEELFGPVLVVIQARDDADAIRIANDTSFGLGAAVFTADTDRGETIARTQIEAGACFVNDFVRSDPRLPFGGVRNSGLGRELSPLGILEFTNAKTVWIAHR